jgi:S-adenosylmethionine-diacylglycerol 3-amino-3-carboxypropyl transferase
VLRDQDNLLVITSAGCNVLDYTLTGPRRILAVDANPRQNALLELKFAYTGFHVDDIRA